MAWEDDDFEQFLTQFRLRCSRQTLPSAQMERPFRMAAIAAAILVIVGTAFAIQYFRTTEPSPSSDVSDQAPIVVAQAAEPASVAVPRPKPAPAPAPQPARASPDAPLLATPPETELSQRKLAPEPRTLTARREIPAEDLPTTPPVTQRDPVGLDREASIEYVIEYNKTRGTLALGTEEEGGGRRLVERACGACHVPTLIENSHWDTPVEYFDFVSRKVASGAQLTREEVPVVVNYLFNAYGRPQPQGPSKTDSGKTVFDAACVQCHAADVMKNHAYTEAVRYREIVTDMIGKGAVVSEPQINPLVDYLMRTYGVRGRP